MKKKNELCSAPFNQIFIQSSGRVYPCAFLQNHTLVGDVREEDLGKIWQGEKMQEFRRLHQEGVFARCRENQDHFQCHKLLSNFPKKEIDKDSLIPPRIDFMIDSFCNLKCTMCTNVLEERGGFEDPEFWRYFEEVALPKIEEVELIGGEPMIIKNTLLTFELIKKVNPKIRVKLTTNAHYKLGEALKKAMRGINFVRLAFSIDSLKEDVFASIRDGGDLKLVLDTIEDYIEFNKTLEKEIPFEVNVVVQRENAYEIPSILQYIRSKNLLAHLIFLVHPDQNSLTQLPEQEQWNIFKFYLEDYEKTKDPELFLVIAKFVRQMVPELRIKASSLLADQRKSKL